MKKGVIAAITAAVTFICSFIVFAPGTSRDVNDFAGAEAVVASASETSSSIEFKREDEPGASKKKGISRVTRWLWRAVKSLAVSIAATAATLLLKLIGSLAGGVFAGAAGTVVGFVLGEFIPMFFATSLMFCLLFKLLFPEIELRSFLSFKKVSVLALGSLLSALASHFICARIENGVVGCLVGGLVSAVVIAAMWYLCFKGGVKTALGEVKLIKTWRAALVLVLMLAASALVGVAKSSLVGMGLSAADAGSYVGCALYCIVLSAAAAYIFNRTKRLRDNAQAA